MSLPPSVDKLVSAVLAVAPNTIIVNQSGTPVEVCKHSSFYDLQRTPSALKDASLFEPKKNRCLGSTKLRPFFTPGSAGTRLVTLSPTLYSARTTPAGSSPSPSRFAFKTAQVFSGFVSRVVLFLSLSLHFLTYSLLFTSAGENGKLFYNDNIFVGYRGLLELE